MREYDSICCFRNRHDDGYRILMEVTDRCNENCVFCHWRDKNTLSLEQIKQIMANLEGIVIHDVILTGGEPLLHKELFDILKWFREKGIECDLCSNGIMVDMKLAERLAGYLTEISISLDTAKPQVYDLLRGTKNGFQRVINGIKCLRKAGIDVHLTCVVNRENREEIEDIINLSKELKVHSISFLGVISDIAKRREETEGIALSEDQKKSVMEVIERFRNSEDGLLINTKRLKACDGEECRAGKNILGITSEGKIMGCIMHREKQFDILNEKISHDSICQLQKNGLRC